ncbi:hypothetical protein [Niameybacter massiliensis]|uniref:hypothetical protein n=1 Tax=Niameybacter massiliensis TaxID=1658108 RepID=UPI0006B66BA7|nr:hypothetical protein [Niameybacter massiliensis]
MKNTTNYGLKKPDGTDAVDIAIINENMDNIDTTMKNNEKQINALAGQIENIDVSSDVRQVINEKVNSDPSKPLNTLINEWLNSAKTAILEKISTLTTHVTSQHTATKHHVSTELSGTNRHITDSLTGTNNHVTACKDNIKDHVTASIANVSEKKYTISKHSLLQTIYDGPINKISGNWTYLGKFVAKRSGTVVLYFNIRQGVTGTSKIAVHSPFSLLPLDGSQYQGVSTPTLDSTMIGFPVNTANPNFGEGRKLVYEYGASRDSNLNQGTFCSVYLFAGQELHFHSWVIDNAQISIFGVEEIL